MNKIFKFLQKEIVSDKEYSKNKSRYMSLIFLSLSFFISFAPLIQDNFTFIQISTDNLVPNDITALFLALFLLFPLISRGIINFSLSTYGLITLFLTFYILSSLITLVSEYSLNLGIIEFDVIKGLFVVMIMSWVGLPLFAFLAQLFCLFIIVLAMMLNNPDFQYEFLLFLYFILFILGVSLNQKTKFNILMNSFFSEYKDIGGLISKKNKSYVEIIDNKIKDKLSKVDSELGKKNGNENNSKSNLNKNDGSFSGKDISRSSSSKIRDIMKILNITDKKLIIKKVNELINNDKNS